MSAICLPVLLSVAALCLFNNRPLLPHPTPSSCCVPLVCLWLSGSELVGGGAKGGAGIDLVLWEFSLGIISGAEGLPVET